MTLTFHALLMLCALGAVVFGASAVVRRRDLVALAAGFLLTASALATGMLAPDATLVATAAACAALVRLLYPRYSVLACACGGAVAAVAGALFNAQGFPFGSGYLVVASFVGASAWLTRTRPVFAPDVIRDEALIAIALFGIAVAVLPAALDGWQAALNLNASAERAGEPLLMPAWTIVVLAMSLACGGIYSLWSRR